MSELDSIYNECLVWAVGLFLIGIMFREFSPDGAGKWIGRAAVAASMFLLSSFSYYAHAQCHVQQQIIAAKSGKNISEQQSASRLALTTSKGNLIEGNLYGRLHGIGGRSSSSSGRSRRIESSERLGTAVYAVPRAGSGYASHDGLVLDVLVPDEQPTENDEYRPAVDVIRAAEDYLHGVFKVAKRTPVKIPSTGEMK